MRNQIEQRRTRKQKSDSNDELEKYLLAANQFKIRVGKRNSSEKKNGSQTFGNIYKKRKHRKKYLVSPDKNICEKKSSPPNLRSASIEKRHDIDDLENRSQNLGKRFKNRRKRKKFKIQSSKTN